MIETLTCCCPCRTRLLNYLKRRDLSLTNMKVMWATFTYGPGTFLHMCDGFELGMEFLQGNHSSQFSSCLTWPGERCVGKLLKAVLSDPFTIPTEVLSGKPEKAGMWICLELLKKVSPIFTDNFLFFCCCDCLPILIDTEQHLCVYKITVS